MGRLKSGSVLLLLLLSLTVAFLDLGALPHALGVLANSFPSSGEKQVDSSTTTKFEPSIASNPTNTNNLVAAYIDFTNGQCITYRSMDLGSTWRYKIVVENANCGDPVVRFGSDGTAYLVYLIDTSSSSAIYLRTSPDGGGSWSSRIRVASGVFWTCGDTYDNLGSPSMVRIILFMLHILM